MGWSSNQEESRADHYRDERKHDFEPIDRLERQIPTALDVASLVKLVDDISIGARLIEQYAKTCAAEARMEATEAATNRIIGALEAPLARKVPV